jgi:hypothetical protein
MNEAKSLPLLFLTITSPTDGARVKGNKVTVTGTAKALRERSDTEPQPQPSPEPIDPGRLPDGPIGDSLPGSSDDLEDITAQIDKVEVKVDTGAGTAEFQRATGTGPDGQFSAWIFEATQPRLSRRTTITARVTLNDQTESKSIQVFGIPVPVLATK